MRLAARLVVAVLLAAVAVVIGAPARAATDEGWKVDSFAAQYVVRADGVLAVVETVDVDFGAQQKHGIFRNIPVRYRYDDSRDRVYDVAVRSVTAPSGTSWHYETSTQGADLVIKIGDADRTVTGKQSYRIAYEVRGALNGFSDHDELFWNVNGEWPARTLAATAHVQIERAAPTSVACYQGPLGSKETCSAAIAGGGADMRTTRLLAPGEQMTVVASFPKGAVPEPRPILEARAREFTQWWDVTPATLGASLLVLVIGLALALRSWLVAGRDPRGPETIVPEYEPPEKLRPAEVGLLVDESADTKDLTATIVQLAVRGYLHIEEVADRGLFGGHDWTLTRLKPADATLALYERRLFEGLFASGDDVKLSDLKGTFHVVLHHAERDLYAASVSSGWFPRDPERVRWMWAAIAVGVIALGAAAAALLGSAVGAGLVGAAVAAVGLVLLALVRAMPRRTAKGRDLLWHIRGFRRYMETAETERQRFAERENIFVAYLPYAIVFGLVSKWAAAFKDIDVQRATQGWYAGPNMLSVAAFSSGLSSFSGSLGTAISSTPASSGASGFGGGAGAGGGGGGGGGGSW
ncbi:MAG: DUF2207 domain-containing protein [Chloroflexota bacterium]|nr:DUF2207 domain-containing protein [Chloroflexota bacterium]